VANDLFYRLEFRLAVVSPETQHLVVVVPFAICLNDAVDELSNLHESGVPGGIADEAVFFTIDAHQDDLLVPGLFNIEFVADPGPDSSDQRPNLGVF
jgi:hypothetical protein